MKYLTSFLLVVSAIPAWASESLKCEFTYHESSPVRQDMESPEMGVPSSTLQKKKVMDFYLDRRVSAQGEFSKMGSFAVEIGGGGNRLFWVSVSDYHTGNIIYKSYYELLPGADVRISRLGITGMNAVFHPYAKERLWYYCEVVDEKGKPVQKISGEQDMRE